MRGTYRLKKPILLTFDHAGRSRAEAITRVTFSSHYDETPAPDDALVRKVCAALEGFDESDLDRLARLDLAGGLRDAYVDAGFRASTFIMAQLAEEDAAGDVRMLDLSEFADRKVTPAEFVP